MATNPPKRQAPKPQRSVIRWLLDSDPSIRWQVMRDLIDAPADEVAAERARVATEGAGARLLALQGADGRWGGAAWNRGWNSTMHVLMLLREMGLDPASDEARRAVGLVRDRVTWQGCGPQECDGNPFFAGEVEPCINGQVGGGRRLLRPGRPGHRRPAARRAAARRRLELRGRQRLDAVVVQHHDLRARGPARVRTGRRGQPGGDRGPSPRAGVPPRAPPLPPAVDRRGDRARSQGRRRVDALRLPDVVALRRAAGARVPAPRRRRARRARGRGDRPGRVEARRRRPVAARDPVPRRDAGRDGRGRGPAEPVEHAARLTSVELVFSTRLTQMLQIISRPVIRRWRARESRFQLCGPASK